MDSFHDNRRENDSTYEDKKHGNVRGRVGLVVEGGGMKCAYSAGVLDRFMDDGLTFDCCIGVSAGAGCLASYLAGQRGRNRRYYTTHVTEPDFFGLHSLLTKKELFGLHYIYRTTTSSSGCDPLDFQTMIKNPSEFILVATDAETGRPRYFRKEEMRQDDYRILMASCAIPGICQPIEIDGRKYFDGGVSDSLPFGKAFEEGCDRVVVIMTKPENFVKEPEHNRAAYTVLLRKYPKIVEQLNHRHVSFNQSLSRLHALEKEGKAFVFYPSRLVSRGTYDMNTRENQEFYNVGKKDYDRLKEPLAAFCAGRA